MSGNVEREKGYKKGGKMKWKVRKRGRIKSDCDLEDEGLLR
jgi:hypothetical protein